LERATVALEGHNPVLGPFFYVNALIVHYPESLVYIGMFVPGIVSNSDALDHGRRVRILAVVWGVIVMVVITVMSTKILQYMLPLGVPVAFVGGAALHSLAESAMGRRGKVTIVGLVMLSASWSALWPVRAFVKSHWLGIGGPVAIFEPQWFMLGVAGVSFAVLVLFALRRQVSDQLVARLWVGVVLLLVVGQCIYEVSVRDTYQYNEGTREVAALARERKIKKILYVGKDLNPALDLYLKGWNSWREDVEVDSYTTEASILSSKRSLVDLSQLREESFLVVENRVANDIENLSALLKKATLVHSTKMYRVYDLR
jgi:hypothetical protein